MRELTTHIRGSSALPHFAQQKTMIVFRNIMEMDAPVRSFADLLSACNILHLMYTYINGVSSTK